MDISTPVWNAKENQYIFRFLGTMPTVENTTAVYIEGPNATQEINIPEDNGTVVTEVLQVFIQKAQRYFTSPLRMDIVQKRLRHEVKTIGLPEDLQEGWYRIHWSFEDIKVQSKAFILGWKIQNIVETEPQISSDFLSSTTPRASSPVSPERTDLRTIHIQDSLIPVGDLPLSDFPTEVLFDQIPDEKFERQDGRRKVREARLRLALAKLKAQRLEEKYYSRYASKKNEIEESSLSSGSESDEGTYL